LRQKLKPFKKAAEEAYLPQSHHDEMDATELNENLEATEATKNTGKYSYIKV
jgi:hypothetical protein